MKIKLKVNDYSDRQDVITGLANAGYSVKVLKDQLLATDTYYIIFECDSDCIIEEDNNE